MKEEIWTKNKDFSLFIKQCCRIVWSVKKILRGDKKSKFIKEQEASRLLSTLGIKAPLSNIYLVGPLLF